MAPGPPAAVAVPRDQTCSQTETLADRLKAVSTAAATRTEEAELLYRGISNLLDAQIQGEDRRDLPPHLRKTFSQLCHDLATVAQRHFESHIRGSPRPPLPYASARDLATPYSPPSTRVSSTSTEESGTTENKTAPPASRKQRAPQKNAATYASITAKSASTTESQAHKRPKKTLARSTPLDNRLFVRLPSNHVLRSVSTYSIQRGLNQALERKLVKEIQTTRTGFALCPISPESTDSLEALIPQITALFSKKGPCVVEKLVT
jgi:hypothetical protein